MKTVREILIEMGIDRPSPEELAANRNDPLWKNIHNYNGSPLTFASIPPDQVRHEFLFRYTKRDENKNLITTNEYGVKEKNPIPNSSIKTTHMTKHFLDRLVNGDGDGTRNFHNLNGDDVNGLKKRAISKIDELGLVGTKSLGKEYREYVFISNKNPKTAGYKIATRIYPNGNVHFVTLLDHTQNVSGTEGLYKSFVESFSLNMNSAEID